MKIVYHGSNMTRIGSCSICGGAVTVPAAWYSTVPPVPSCSECGAIAAAPKYPVIPMEPTQKGPPPVHDPFTTNGVTWPNK